MSCKKKIAHLLNQSNSESIHPALIESVLLDNDCKKYLKKNPNLSALLKNTYQNNLMAMADDITAMSRQSFAALEAINNYEDGDKKPDSHKQLIAIHNSIKNYILQDVLQYAHIDARTLVLERWIAIVECFEISADFNSYMAALSAIKMLAYYLKATVQGLSKPAYRYMVNESINMMHITPSARATISLKKNSTHLITPYFGDFRTLFLSLAEVSKLTRDNLESKYNRQEIDEIEYNSLKTIALDKYTQMVNEKTILLTSLRDMHRFLFPSFKKGGLVTEVEIRRSNSLSNENIPEICRSIEDKMTDTEGLNARSCIFQDNLISAFVFNNRAQVQQQFHIKLANCLLEKSEMARAVFTKLKTIFDHSTTEHQLMNSYIAYHSDLIQLENNCHTIETLNNDLKNHLKKSPVSKSNPLINLTKNIHNNLLGKDHDAEIKIQAIESYAILMARQAYKKSLILKLTIPAQAGDTPNESVIEYESAIELTKAAKKEVDIIREKYNCNEIKAFIAHHHRQYNNNLGLINQYKYEKRTITDKQRRSMIHTQHEIKQIIQPNHNLVETATAAFPQIQGLGIFHTATNSHEQNGPIPRTTTCTSK